MATNTLNVRVQNKKDTLENWTTNNPVLLNGEIAIVEIPESSSPGGGIIPPALVFKVGDGTKNFNSLEWVQAVAADVHAWAKAETKPTYQASEIEGLSDFISGAIEDTNTQYSFSISGNQITIKKKEVGEADFSPYQTIDLPQPDLSGLATKVADATANNLAGLTADGNLQDSGIAAANVMEKVAGATDGHVASLNTDGEVVDGGVAVSGLATKAASPTAGNVLVATADGNLQDGGTALSALATQEYVNSAIGNITEFSAEVVEELPQTGENGVLYLVDNSGSGQNVYDEYIWVASESKFEKIGTTDIDLSGYATTAALNSGLATKVNGLASGTTAGHVVTWGADGYTVADSGYTIESNVPSGAVFTDTGITSVVANNGLTQSISDRELTLGISSVNGALLTQTTGDYLIFNCGSSSTVL